MIPVLASIRRMAWLPVSLMKRFPPVSKRSSCGLFSVASRAGPPSPEWAAVPVPMTAWRPTSDEETAYRSTPPEDFSRQAWLAPIPDPVLNGEENAADFASSSTATPDDFPGKSVLRRSLP